MLRYDRYFFLQQRFGKKKKMPPTPSKYVKSHASPSEVIRPPTFAASTKKEVEPMQYVRMPEGGTLMLKEGSIKKLISAVYRVESTHSSGMEMDVTHIVEPLVKNGSLQVEVSNQILTGRREKTRRDTGRVLIVSYVPVSGGINTALAKPVGARDPDTQFMRVPEHTRLYLPKSTIIELISADYRVEGHGKIGLQKDVTDIIYQNLDRGGLDMVVNNYSMRINNDPHPEQEKILMISYKPRLEPAEVLIEVRDGCWLEIPEGNISRLVDATYEIPYHDPVGHGWGVDVKKQIENFIKNQGIYPGLYINTRVLGITYDPFPDYAKVLKIRYQPRRLLPSLDEKLHDTDSVLKQAEMLLQKPYQCGHGRSRRSKLLKLMTELIQKVIDSGGWGDQHLTQAQNLLRNVSNDMETTLTHKLLSYASSGYADEDLIKKLGLDDSFQPGYSQPEPDLHPSAAYHVGHPLGGRRQ